MRLRSRGFRPTGAVMPSPMRRWRHGAIRPTDAGTLRTPVSGYTPIRLAGCMAGERIRCRGAVRPFRGGAESYRRLMARRGYAGTLWIAERTLLERLPDRHAGLHRRAVERLSRLPMSAGAAAVVEAMAAGERRGVTPELRTAYSRSGLSHMNTIHSVRDSSALPSCS